MQLLKQYFQEFLFALNLHKVSYTSGLFIELLPEWLFS